MSRRFGSVGIVLAVVLVGVVLAVWKYASLRAADAAASMQHQPLESVTVAVARPVEHRQTTSSIGTVLAMQSITLRNELPGTVRQVALEPGQIVEAGTVLVALDVAVEEAELRAQQAQAALAETVLARTGRLRADRMMFVSMSPGQTTETPSGAPVASNSLYIDSDSATTPCLVTS